MHKIATFSVVLFASIGLMAQCFSNLRTKRAEFLAFPIALFLLMPYPIWVIFAWVRHDWMLVGIMTSLGLPSAWLSSQYFQFEWPRRSQRTLFLEERIALYLLVVGLILLVSLLIGAGALTALGLTAAYFTCCLMIYSFLVKLWKVSRGEQTIAGIRWIALISLSLLYGTMILYGQNKGIILLKIAYGFAELCCLLAILYKLFGQSRINVNLESYKKSK